MDGLTPLAQRSHHSSVNPDGQDIGEISTSLSKSNLFTDDSYAHKNCFGEHQHEQSTIEPQENDVSLHYESTFDKINDTLTNVGSDNNLQKQQLSMQLEYANNINNNENHFQTNQCEQQNMESQNCGMDTRMSEDDAFIAYCTDSSSVLHNDSNQRYYINKLYQPLNNGSNTQNQSRNQQTIDGPSQLDEQDDEYLLYQELKFIESNAQKTSLSHEESELSKIFQDDDDTDGTALGKEFDNSLDCLQLTSIIESFDDYASSPLIESCSTNELLTPQSYPQMPTNGQQNSFKHLKERSSPINDQNAQKIDFTPTVGYNSTENQYNSVENQNMFNQDFANQSVSSYTNSTLSHQQNENLICERVFQSHEEFSNRHQEISNDFADCIQPGSSSEVANQTNSTTVNGQVEMSTDKMDGQTMEFSNTRKRRPSNEEVKDSKACNKRLKKKRSTLSIAAKSKQTHPVDAKASISTTTSDQDKHIRHGERVQSDEDESLVSDNNSMKSDISRKHPIVNHYRRRTANARERIRMREINQAFEKLKKVVPIELVQQAALESEEMSDQASRRKSSPSSSPGQQVDSVKLTKITTLRLAVSYIAKLTEILNENPEPSLPSNAVLDNNLTATTMCNQEQAVGQTKEISVKTKRRSRSTSKKLPLEKGKKRTTKSDKAKDDHSCSQKISIDDKVKESEPVDRINNHNHISNHQTQEPIIISNSITNKVSNQNQQQTAFLSIPSQQKQYLTTYPNQQQLLFSQPLGNGNERTIVTPVAVAILGIPAPNANNQQAISSEMNSSQNIQIVGIQKPSQQAILGQQQPAYNLQLAQNQPLQRQQQYQSYRQPQQVTLTLDDVSGLSVLRLANTQFPNQSMPIQFRAIQTKQNQPFMQHALPQQSATQLFTTQNGVDYALQPIQANNATLTTGTNSDQVSNITISSKDTPVFTEQRQTHISHQPVNGAQQQQQSNIMTSKTVFIPTSNFMTFSNGNNQLIQPRQVSLQSPFGSEVQVRQNKTASLVYINPMSQSGDGYQPTQHRVCILTNQTQGSHAIKKQVQSNDPKQEPQICLNEQEQTLSKPMHLEKMGYVTHFNAHSEQNRNNNNESNITQLVASLATSIQPQNINLRPTTSASSDSNVNESFQHKSQQQVAQNSQQQPVRTYRFHNYDGKMINNHLYGNNNQANQPQNSTKRAHQSKQQRDTTEKTAEPQTVASKQRSRQNSLSSICSTTSCSSSSLNYTSSTGGSPSNTVQVVPMVVSSSPIGCNNS